MTTFWNAPALFDDFRRFNLSVDVKVLLGQMFCNLAIASGHKDIHGRIANLQQLFETKYATIDNILITIDVKKKEKKKQDGKCQFAESERKVSKGLPSP
jgi:hypothetical protein